MLYELQQAPSEKSIFKQLGRRKLKRGQKLELPSKMAQAPVLIWGLELYWNAWWDLEPDRRTAKARLSWSQIMDYAARKGFDEYQTESTLHHVRAMDTAFLTWYGKKKPDTRPPREEKESDDAQGSPRSKYGYARRTQRQPADDGEAEQ